MLEREGIVCMALPLALLWQDQSKARHQGWRAFVQQTCSSLQRQRSALESSADMYSDPSSVHFAESWRDPA